MGIDYELEIDKLLEDGSHTMRSLARELLELKLEKIPLLQEELRDLKAEHTNPLSNTQISAQRSACASSDYEEESAVYTDSEYESTTEGSSVVIRSDLFWFPFHWFADDLDPPDDLPADSPLPIPSLPTDIVHIIFEHLLPNMDVVDFSTRGRLQWRRDARTKTSIARVCQAWHSVALEFLYRDVVLRYAIQIIDFARTISENPVTFGSRVRRLVFTSRCLLPNGLSDSDDVHDAISTVLVHCPRVSRVSFGGFVGMDSPAGEAEIILSRRGPPGAVPKTDDQSINLFSPSWILHIPSGAFRYLRSLEVALCSESAKHHEDSMHFPVLDTLILRLPVMAYNSSHSEPLHYPVSWTMPSIRHLRFRCSAVELVVTPSFSQFFDKYGPDLRSLGFGQQMVRENNALTLTFLMKRCPNLDHLAIEWGYQEALRSPPGGQTIRHLDMILPDTFSEEYSESFMEMVLPMGLGWTSTRFFESSVITVLPDLPFCPLLPRTWSEFDAMHLKSPLDISGYQIYVRARRREGVEVPDLVVYEGDWN